MARASARAFSAQWGTPGRYILRAGWDSVCKVGQGGHFRVLGPNRYLWFTSPKWAFLLFGAICHFWVIPALESLGGGTRFLGSNSSFWAKIDLCGQIPTKQALWSTFLRNRLNRPWGVHGSCFWTEFDRFERFRPKCDFLEEAAKRWFHGLPPSHFSHLEGFKLREFWELGIIKDGYFGIRRESYRDIID